MFAHKTSWAAHTKSVQELKNWKYKCSYSFLMLNRFEFASKEAFTSHREQVDGTRLRKLNGFILDLHWVANLCSMIVLDFQFKATLNSLKMKFAVGSATCRLRNDMIGLCVTRRWQ